jgi:ABC-type cobalamin/Fe3+-siderophores transport system ATPase subunit
MTFAIQADQVVVNFASGRALDAVSLTLGRGEFVALVGPNGSGKTTLLRVLAANLRPDHGTVYLSGRDLRSWRSSEMARHLASVPQRLPDTATMGVLHVEVWKRSLLIGII